DKGKGGGGKGGAKGGGFSLPPTIKLTIAGVGADGMFPAANAGQGKSPAISWSVVPAGTQAFALLMHDPEPVIGKNAIGDVTHWVVFDIPGTATGLPAGVAAGELPDGTKQGGNITNAAAYMGPGPPAGHGIHHYTFELWALDAKLGLPNGASRDDVMKAMNGHVIGKGYAITPFENK
ncbi:MAG: YbhB/YbcL family Raf kinase inhibitor-like protein, partial [Acidobacteriota bacterium]